MSEFKDKHTILVDHTKLSNVARAIRTCYNSFGHNKGCYIEPTDNITQEDKELVIKVVKKFRHASTAEHCRFVFKTKDKIVADVCQSNNFSYVKTIVKDCKFQYHIIQTNLRVLLENQEFLQGLIQELPEEFKFLFESDKTLNI